MTGALIGRFVPLLLVLGGKQFGVSANLRHLCAAAVPGRLAFLKYDWRKSGLWNLTFALGIGLGGLLATTLLASATASPTDRAHVGAPAAPSITRRPKNTRGGRISPIGSPLGLPNAFWGCAACS